MAKTEISPGFVLAFLQAKDKANKTGEKQPIKGYPSWKVSPQKELEDEAEAD